MIKTSFYVVTYKGPLGFIKPWTALRDDTTFSQAFLTPSILEGMRQKLDVLAILRHRLSHGGLSAQQEVVQAADYESKTKSGARTLKRATGVLVRHVMVEPVLHLAFPTLADAEKAASQHLCLCRNEDLVYPVGDPVHESIEAFNARDGFELLPSFPDEPGAFLVGYNRFFDLSPMYGRLLVFGNPIHGAQ